jgi:hypothetical protein
MVNVFEVVVRRLIEVGFYDFLIFLLALGFFYAIVKKGKVFGESPLAIGLIAFAAAFLVFGYPVILGISLVTPLVTFFAQSFLWIIIFFVAFLIASMFYPDLPAFLKEHFTSRSMVTYGIAIGIATAVLSGMVTLIWTAPTGEDATGPQAEQDVGIIAGGIIIFVILLIIAGSLTLGD